MKNFTFLFLLFPIITFAQLPNGSFENWTLDDTNTEKPDDWIILNETLGFVVKSAIAADGDFSAFLQNNDATAAIWLQTTFTPIENVNKLTGLIRIDPTTIQDGARIMVNGWSAENYITMGQIRIHEVTTGFIPFEIPLDSPETLMDSIRVNIQVGPTAIVPGIAVGFGNVYIDKLAIIDSTLVSTATINPDNRVNIFPNPASDYVQIQSDLTTPVDLNIYDITGKLVLRQLAIQDQETVPLANLERGIYMIHCYAIDGIIYQKKIIKL